MLTQLLNFVQIKTYDYSIIRSKRRTLQITVNPDLTVVVRVPNRYSDSAIAKHLLARKDWIEKQLERFKDKAEQYQPREIKNGALHQYIGAEFALKIEIGIKEFVDIKGKNIIISSFKPNNQEHVQKQLEGWYRQQAKLMFKLRLDEIFLRFPYKERHRPKLVVKKMKTRWGSLSSKGFINLNLTLIKAPMQLIDYVIIHELCHIKHKNHQAGFYKMQEQYCPNWKALRTQLNEEYNDFF